MKPLRQFDLNLLLLLEVLLTECHVSRAAEKMYLSQSAMSHALSRLRTQLDDPLLVRTTQGLQPTPRAQAMLPEIRKAIQMIERALIPEQAFIPEQSDRYFRIACTDYFEATVLPELISQLQTISPQIYIEVEMIHEASYSEQLESGELDLVVGLDSSARVPPHLHNHPWLTEKLLCLCGPENAGLPDTLNLEQYLSLSHIVFSDSAGEHSSVIDEWLREQSLTRSSIARTTNYMAAARTIARTQSIMTLPEKMARLFSTMLPLRLIEPPAGIPSSQMQVLYHPLQSKDPGLSWLLRQIYTVSGANPLPNHQ